MSEYSKISHGIASIKSLERELHLKQLQINHLLTITQAINNNVKAAGLFDMYKSFLSWEMGIQRMALYFKNKDKWTCSTHSGFDETLLDLDISDHLRRYERLSNLEGMEHPLIRQFEVVVPVHHKNEALAYVFIGGFKEDEDMYNKIQFITTITNIIAVAIENKRLFNQQIEQERVNRDIELASQMQRLLIPKSLPSNEFYQLASIYQPVYGVGGDYFDCIEFADGKVTFCVGDISGKGVAAALLMANFQARFHNLIYEHFDMDDFVRALNHAVRRITGGDLFITFFVAEYDRKTRTLSYINAGHNPPILIQEGGMITELKEGSTILGTLKELPEVKIGKVHIPKSAMIIAYTDGLSDIRNEKNEFLEEGLAYNFVRNHWKEPVDVFNEKLLRAIKIYKGEMNFPDDITVLTCKIS